MYVKMTLIVYNFDSLLDLIDLKSFIEIRDS